MVKIRGYRVEIGEIENVLKGKIGILEVAVITQEFEGTNQLVCFYVEQIGITLDEIRSYLATELPKYMIPLHFIKVNELPLTPNGKINRNKLLELAKKMNELEAKEKNDGLNLVLPADELEEKLIKVWKRVLNRDPISMTDNFFELGGHSLLVIKLQVELEREGIFVHPSIIYETKTCIAFAQKYRSITKNNPMYTIDEHNAFENINSVSFNPSTFAEDVLLNKPLTLTETVEYSTNRFALEGIEPFNHIFYRSCFFNSLFPVVQAFQKNIYSFLVNDLIIFEQDSEEKQMIEDEFNINAPNGIRYLPVKPVPQIIFELGMVMKTKSINNELIDDIFRAIDQRRMVIVWVDCYYESIRHDTFQKRHFQHTLLIYGYNKEKRLFDILEHKEADTLSYYKTTISFEDLSASYYGYIEHFFPVF